MTSSNVSNLLIQVSNISVEMPDSKMASQPAGGLFEKTLQNVADSNVSVKTTPGDTVSKSGKSEIETAAAKLSKTKEATGKPQEEQPSTDAEVVSKVEEVVSEVKEIIEEELGVTEEDIENAMETLGLTLIDLLNPQNLAEVVANLTNQEDSISLVMSEEFKNILDAVTDLSEQLFTDTGLDFKAIKEMFLEAGQLPVQEPVEMTEVMPQVEIPNTEIESETTITVEEITDEPILEAIPIPVEPKKADETKTVDVKTDDIEATSSKEEEPVSVLTKTEDKQDAPKKENQEFTNNKDFNQQLKNTKVEIKGDSETEIRAENAVFTQPREDVQFLPKEQIVALPTGETVTTEEIVNQFIEQARVLNDAETTTMEMTLNPEGLGKIFMEVTQKGDEITAKIFTENDAVKQALETQMANLRFEVNQTSTKVTSIEVSVGAHEFERNLEEDAKGDERRENQTEQSQKRSSRINLNSLDDLSGLMSDEDMLIAQMMKDNGNTLDFQA